MSCIQRAVLNILWSQGPLQVRDVYGRLTKLGYKSARSSVVSLLIRMETNGYLTSDKSQHAFVYKALVSSEDVINSRITKLAGELYDGNVFSMMLAYANRHRFSRVEIDRLQCIIDTLTQRM